MKIITEIVEFKILENISKEDFIKIVDMLETGYHLKQSGYMDTELAYDDKNNKWIVIQHWDSQENMRNASAKMFKEDSTKEFREVLIKESVNMSILFQLKTW